MDALDALSLATINTLSVAIMVAGGASWALDISSLEDMRRKARGAIYGGTGVPLDQGADEELEEWIATVLARKEFKDILKKNRQAEEEGKKGDGEGKGK